jgi:hypothetical protein
VEGRGAILHRSRGRPRQPCTIQREQMLNTRRTSSGTPLVKCYISVARIVAHV